MFTEKLHCPYLMERLNYLSLFSKTLDTIEDRISKMPFVTDISLNQESLSWKIKNIGEYVLNRQPPLKQLWFSSPITGPSRFQIKNKLWVHTKSNKKLDEFLNDEINQIKSKINL